MTIAHRGLPSAAYSIDWMSSGGPAAHAANDGEASNPLSFIASAIRSSGGKNWSSSNTPSLRIGGLPIMSDERREVERPPLAPRMCDQVRQQDVLAAGQRIGVDPHQPEQPGDVALDLVADDLGVAGVGRDLQRADDVDRHTRLRAGRVDREVGGGAQGGHVLGGQAPSGKPLVQVSACCGGEHVGRDAGGGRLGFVDPRAEVGRLQRREGQAQVGQVALGVDQQCRHDRTTGPPRSARSRGLSCRSRSCRRSRRGS